MMGWLMFFTLVIGGSITAWCAIDGYTTAAWIAGGITVVLLIIEFIIAVGGKGSGSGIFDGFDFGGFDGGSDGGGSSD